MKILILANNSGGLANFRGKLIENLSINAEIIAGTPIDIRKDDLIKMGVSIYEIQMDRRSMNPIKDLHLLNQYRTLMKTVKPDYVITYTIKPNIYGGLLCSIKNIRYAANVTGLGTAFEKGGIVTRLVTFLYRFGLKKANVVFFENSNDAKLFFEKKIVTQKQIQVLNGAGVDIERFKYQEYPYNKIFKFLFVGRVMKEKGVEELFHSMDKLIHEGVKAELIILGRLEENYRNMILNYEKEGWLRYLGIQEDVRPFIAECDCFVLPSYHEGMANTNLECASSGRPIITSNIPGCREAVVEGSGLLCDPKSDDSLYKAMKTMYNLNIEERRQMGLKGRRHMEDVFDKKKVVAETIKNLF